MNYPSHPLSPFAIRTATAVGTPVYRTRVVLASVLPDFAVDRAVRSNGKQPTFYFSHFLLESLGIPFPPFRIDFLDSWMRRNCRNVNSVSGLTCLPQIWLIRVRYAAVEIPFPSSPSSSRSARLQRSLLPSTVRGLFWLLHSSISPSIGRSVQMVSNPFSVLHISLSKASGFAPLPFLGLFRVPYATVEPSLPSSPRLRDPCGCNGPYSRLPYVCCPGSRLPGFASDRTIHSNGK